MFYIWNDKFNIQCYRLETCIWGIQDTEEVFYRNLHLLQGVKYIFN